MKRWHLMAGLSAAILFSTPALADGVGVSLKAGTLGLGSELTKSFTPKINGRLGFNTFKRDASGTESDVNYDTDLKLSSVTALVDWHPTGGSFRASAGVVSNNNKLEMTAVSAANYDIGGTTYTSGQIGTLSGLVDFKSLAPYIGIGWGNAVEDGQNLTFTFDLGAVMQGAPNVDLSTTSSVPGLSSDLVTEEQQLAQSLDDFKIYPVISFGLGWQF